MPYLCIEGLRKDLILNEWPIIGTYVLWSTLWLGGPTMGTSGELPFGAWSGMVSVACAFLPVMMLVREDKFRAGALSCSLPVTRDTIVASRYVGGWIMALAAVAIAMLGMLVLSTVDVRPLLPPTPMLPVTVVTVVGIALAVMMPVAIRYGATGVIGLLVALQVLGVIVLLAGSLFGIPAARGIGLAVRSLVRSGEWLHGVVGTVAFSAATVAGVLALNYASFRLSSSLYRRREF